MQGRCLADLFVLRGNFGGKNAVAVCVRMIREFFVETALGAKTKNRVDAFPSSGESCALSPMSSTLQHA